MKKTAKYALLLLCIAVFSFLYAHVDKKEAVYDKQLDTSLYGNMGELVKDMKLEQTFHNVHDVLDGVSMKFATFGNTLSSTYNFEIRDNVSGEVLREGTLDSSKVKNGKYYTLDFEQIKGCEGKEYSFVMYSKDAASGNALTVYNVPKGDEKTQLNLNDDKFSDNTLALRIISHQFDWETFFGVILCLLYLYVFLVVLFKFFR